MLWWAMGQLGEKSKVRKIAETIFVQFILWFFCVAFPAGWTAAAPVSWVKFERHDERVTARARTCLLFIIPFKFSTVDPVIGIGDRSVSGSTRIERRSGANRDRHVTSEAKGYLIINGPDQAAEILVTPHNLKSVVERAESFLNDPGATELKLFVVANWKFSVFGGALVSLLPLLIISSFIYVAGQKLGRALGFGRRRDCERQAEPELR